MPRYYAKVVVTSVQEFSIEAKSLEDAKKQLEGGWDDTQMARNQKEKQMKKLAKYSVGVWKPENVEVMAYSITDAMRRVNEGEGEFAQGDGYADGTKCMGRNAVSKLED